MVVEYKIPKFVLIFLVSLPIVIFFCIFTITEYRNNKKKKEFYKVEYNFIVEEKTIDSTYGGRMNKFIILHNSKFDFLYRLDHKTFNVFINKVWDSATIGDSIYKKKNTWYLILDKKNNPQNKTDTFWYGPRYFKKLN